MSENQRGTAERAAHAQRLGEMRALAHPLRLRLCELFAECPRTTKQVAAILGEPPTRLYHHVHALERAGLLRLRETRKKRGTHELYYEVPSSITQDGWRSSPRDKDPQSRRQRAALAATALNVTQLELASALDRPHARHRRRRPLVARAQIFSPAAADRIRDELMALLRRHAAACAREERAKKMPGKGGERWSLTIALVPSRNEPRAP